MTRRGSVIRRGDRFSARLGLKGERIYLDTYDTEEEAWAAIDAYMRTRQAPTRETVADFASRWVTDYPRNRASTNATNASAAKQIAAHRELGRMLMRDVTRPVARSFAQKHPHLHAVARSMFADAIDDGLIQINNPFSNLRLPQSRGRADIEPLTPDEVEDLANLAMDVFADHWHPTLGPMMRGVILMAAYTCVRPGELFALERDAVDLKNNILHVHRRAWQDTIETPKGNKKRSIALLDQARDGYLSIPVVWGQPCPTCTPRTCKRIFSTKNGGMFTQSSFYPYWNALRTAFEAQLPPSRANRLRATNKGKHLPFYILRHTGATIMLNAGVAPADVAHQLGHSDSQLIERLYGHPDDALTRQRIREAMRQKPRELRVVKDEAANG